MNKIFIDMDDVVADFTNFVKNELHIKNHIDENWREILKKQRIYSLLPKMKDADYLIDECLKFSSSKNYEILFLTAVPRRNDMPWAFYDKIKWAEKYYPNIPVWFGPFSKDKQDHCKKGDILIDDRIDNIKNWIDKNGIGILHKNAYTTVQQLCTFC